MKKLRLILCASLIVLSFMMPVLAQDIVLQDFIIGTAEEISSTGFFEGDILNGASGTVVDVQDSKYTGSKAILLKGTGADSQALIYYGIPSDKYDGQKPLIFKTWIKTDEVENASKKTIDIKIDKKVMIPFRIEGNTVISNGETVSGVTIEAGTFYEIMAVLRRDGTGTLIDLYIDGLKVSSVDKELAVNELSPKLEIQIDRGIGTLYIGESSLYQPDAPAASVKKSVLDNLSEAVELEFSQPMQNATVKRENITITDLSGNEVSDFTVTTDKTDAGALATKATITSASLTQDNEYTISFSDSFIDVAGQKIGESVKFETKPIGPVYQWTEDVKLNGSETGTLVSGLNTITIKPKNAGYRPRPVSVIAVLYDGNEIIDYVYTFYNLQAQEQTGINFGINVDSVTADTKLKVMIWKTPFGGPLRNEQTFN